jgi:xylan 1,4-beta-xylosidase
VRLSVPVGSPSSPLSGIPSGRAFLLRSSVSEEKGNAWRAWCEMGRPASPGPRQLDALREAAEPVRSHRSLPIEDGRVVLDVTLDRHEVTLLEITPVVDETPPWGDRWDDRRLLGLDPLVSEGEAAL